MTRRCGNLTGSSTRWSRSGRPWGWTGENFVLYGQSMGRPAGPGVRAVSPAATCGGLVISNMMASSPAYTAYAEQVLIPAMDPGVLAEVKALEASGDIENPRYMELLMPHYYEHHTLRMPAQDWPGPGRARLRAHQPEDLRADAGAERNSG